MALSGSCLCQGVRYEIQGELKNVYNCHCSMCRKLHAAAFRTSAKIRSADLKTLQGQELIRLYAIIGIMVFSSKLPHCPPIVIAASLPTTWAAA